MKALLYPSEAIPKIKANLTGNIKVQKVKDSINYFPLIWLMCASFYLQFAGKSSGWGDMNDGKGFPKSTHQLKEMVLTIQFPETGETGNRRNGKRYRIFGVLFRMGKEEYLWGEPSEFQKNHLKKYLKHLIFDLRFGVFWLKKQAKTILHVTNCFQWIPPMTNKAI